MFTHPFSQAVRQDFFFSLQRGIEPNNAVLQMRKEYGTTLDDPATHGRFVLAIAVSAWQAGRLYPRLLGEALHLIDGFLTQSDRVVLPHRALQVDLEKIAKTLRQPQPEPVDLTDDEALERLDRELHALALQRPAA